MPSEPPVELSQPELPARRRHRVIEEYRPGYPQYTTLLASADPFLVCRRFRRLRARLILLKQDKIMSLEQELDRLDDEEPHALNLSQLRLDQNEDRQKLLVELEHHLAEYGTSASSREGRGSYP